MVCIKQLMQNTFNGKYIKQLLFFSKFLISIGIPTKFIPYFKMMTPVYIYIIFSSIYPSIKPSPKCNYRYMGLDKCQTFIMINKIF